MTGNDSSPITLPEYVPEPKAAQADRMIGVHFFPGWKPGSHWGFSVLKDYPERKPLLGYYDESSPEVTDWQIKWAVEHGIQFFVYCWYRKYENAGQPISQDALFLGHAIHEGLFRSRFGDTLRFAIMWENFDTRGAIKDLTDLRENMVPFWIDQYFSRPNYLRLDDTPVLFVYHLDTLIAQTGGTDGARRAIQIIRDGMNRAGLGNGYVMCEHRSADRGFIEKAAQCGFDAVLAYCWHAKERFPNILDAMDQQLEKMQAWKEYGVLPFPPTATVGWDPMPWANDKPESPWLHPDKLTRWYSSPEEYRTLLQRIKAFTETFPPGHLARRMLLLDNWNEWGEGHYLLPHAAGGFGYLQAVWSTFTDCANIPDHRSPESLGLGPYGPETLE